MVAGGLSAAYALRLHLLAYGFTAAPGQGAQPAPAAYAAMAALASFSLVLSILWLPRPHEAVTKFSGTDIPKPTNLETVSPTPSPGLGLLSSLFLLRHLPALASGGRRPRAPPWRALP